MFAYKFLETTFEPPVILGENSRSGSHYLKFERSIGRNDSGKVILIRAALITEALSSDNRFMIKANSLFQVLDEKNIFGFNIYEMYEQALSDLLRFLEMENYLPAITIRVPPMGTLLGELIDFALELRVAD